MCRLDIRPPGMYIGHMTTTRSPRTNRYDATCRRCHGSVPAGEGRLIDQSGGGRRKVWNGDRWQVEHLDESQCETVTVAHDDSVTARMLATRNSYENRLAVWHERRNVAYRLGVDPDMHAGPKPEEQS